MTLMKPVLKGRITKRGHKFDEHVCHHRAKSTRNWSFLTPGCRTTGALVFHVSLHWEHRFRRVAASTLRQASVRADARGGRIFFSPPRRVVAKIHADFSRGSLRRAFANHREKKHPSGQPLFPPPPSRRALFSFCRRCPTWRYVKRIYNWRYDGQALESNTSILIPATYSVHPSHPAYAPLSLLGQPLECQSAPWPIGFYRVDIEFIPHSREIWWEICGQGWTKANFSWSRVLSPLPIVFKVDNFIFCSMYMRDFPCVRKSTECGL